MLKMAKEIAAAVIKGITLRIGRPWLLTRSEAVALFVWDHQATEDVNASSFAFTSSRPRGQLGNAYDAYDTDRHVALEVSLEKRHREQFPALYGWCFFPGHKRANVVFPPVPLEPTQLDGPIFS